MRPPRGDVKGHAFAPPPGPGRPDGGRDLRGLGREVGIAAMQVERMGSPASTAAGARRELYRLLADDPGDDTATSLEPTDATTADEG